MYDAETRQEIDVDEHFCDMLDECWESVTIGDIEFLPSQILQHCDPIAYRVYRSDYESDMIESGEWVESLDDLDEDEEDED